MNATRTVGMIALALGFLVAPNPGEGQPSTKVHKLGFLMAMDPQSEWQTAFKQGLQALGWIEGQDIVLEYRSADGYFDRLPGLCSELVSLGVELILAVSAPETAGPRNARTLSRLSSQFTGIPLELAMSRALRIPAETPLACHKRRVTSPRSCSAC
jgi:hypothetical protein